MFLLEVTRKEFNQAITKIKEIFSRHKSRIDDLEARIKVLESEVNSPWKMPFD